MPLKSRQASFADLALGGIETLALGNPATAPFALGLKLFRRPKGPPIGAPAKGKAPMRAGAANRAQDQSRPSDRLTRFREFQRAEAAGGTAPLPAVLYHRGSDHRLPKPFANAETYRRLARSQLHQLGPRAFAGRADDYEALDRMIDATSNLAEASGMFRGLDRASIAVDRSVGRLARTHPGLAAPSPHRGVSPYATNSFADPVWRDFTLGGAPAVTPVVVKTREIDIDGGHRFRWEPYGILGAGTDRPRYVRTYDQPAYTEADKDSLRRILWAEARGESSLGREAVGASVLNRARMRHLSPYDTIRQKDSYEGYDNAAYREMAPGHPRYLDVTDEVEAVLDGFDPTDGATHFLGANAQHQKDRSDPKWNHPELYIGKPAERGKIPPGHSFSTVPDELPTDGLGKASAWAKTQDVDDRAWLYQLMDERLRQRGF